MDKNKRKRSNFTYAVNYRQQQQNKRRRPYILETGIKGFFCTCNGKEKECIRESYNILNYYADQLIGPEESRDGTSENNKESKDDIEEELTKEVTNLKEKNSAGQRRFQAVETGANGCVFIKTTIEDPVQLANSIFEDVEKTKQQKGRFLLRLVPIEVTCKAYIEDIRKTADQLFDKHFRCDPTTFSVIFNKRNNNSVLRDEVIESLARIVTDKNVQHKADLKHPKLAIIVEIVKGICCMSVLTDYEKFKKYNIYELANPSHNQSSSTSQANLDVKVNKDDNGSGGDNNVTSNTRIVFKDDDDEEEKSEDSKCDNKSVVTTDDHEVKDENNKETKDETADEEKKCVSESTEEVKD